jgi:hypothetical protein
MISLFRLPVSLMISRLLSTLRVSRQCHLAATGGSKADNSRCSANAALVSVDDGVSSERRLKRSSRSGGSEAIDSASVGESMVGAVVGASEAFEESRLGKMRCCIQ